MSEIYLSRNPDTASRMLGDELIVMSVTDSTLFSLNETAAIVWQAADGRTALSEIVARAIVPRFEIDPAAAYRDAVEFAEELARHGILRIAREPRAPEAA